MIILGIETSCDETALSLIETEGNPPLFSFKVLGEELISQVKVHEKYGGVFPMLAKREHGKNLVPLFLKILEKTEALDATNESKKHEVEEILEREPELKELFIKHILPFPRPKIDKIAVTYGPGLEPALWVGINFAKALGTLWDIPVVPTNHMEGHIVASLVEKTDTGEKIKDIPFPALSLLISGGHTELVLMKDFGEYEIVGKTLDDAVGEAFDKVARILGLPYPGGPQISKLAEKARSKGIIPTHKLPRPMLRSGNLNFSFSGLKTAVLYSVKELPELTDNLKEEIALEFEEAATEVLLEKTKSALEEHGARTILIGGGVIANACIRDSFLAFGKERGIPVLLPDAKLATDNALMIAIAGAFHEKTSSDFKAEGNLSL